MLVTLSMQRTKSVNVPVRSTYKLSEDVHVYVLINTSLIEYLLENTSGTSSYFS